VPKVFELLPAYLSKHIKPPDEISLGEEFNYNLEVQRYDIVYKYHYLEARKIYANRVFMMVCFWLSIIILIVVLQGFKCVFGCYFKLSDAVLITLITTTTVNVLAFLTIVIRNLFPDPNRGK
jgi:hypothetical protein